MIKIMAETLTYLEREQVSMIEYLPMELVIYKMGKPERADLHNRSEN
jgi:hypothetical protein